VSVTTTDAPLLRGVGLSWVVHGRAILDEVSVAARPGRILGIVGPNGAGKSTLLRLLLGIISPSRGELFLGDTPYGSLCGQEARRAFARQVALVPQEISVAFPFRVREVVGLGRLPHLPSPGFFPTPARLGLGRPEDEAHTERALRTCSLEALADRPLGSLSGGERRRVFLARALAQDARVLLLDEPTGALDVAQQLALQTTLRALAANGRAIVTVGHDLSWVAELCDDVLLLRAGREIGQGPIEDALTPEALGKTFDLAFEAVTFEDALQRRRRVFFPGLPAR